MLEILGVDNGPRVFRRTFSPGGCSTSGHHGKRKLAFGLLNRSPVWPFLRQKLPNRPQYPLPHRAAIQVALIEQPPCDVGAQKKRWPVCWTGAWARPSFASHPCWCLVRQGRRRHLLEGDNAYYRATLIRTPSSCPAGPPGSSSPHGQCYRRQSRSTSPPRLAVGSAYCAPSHTAGLPERYFASSC